MSMITAAGERATVSVPSATPLAKLDVAITRFAASAGLLLWASWQISEILRPAQGPWWWQAAHAVLAMLFGAIALGARRWSFATVRALAVITSCWGGLIQLASFAAHPIDPMMLIPWDMTWLLTAVYLALLVPLSPARNQVVRIVLLAVVFAMLPVVAYVSVHGLPPAALLYVFLTQFSNVVYPLLLIAFRRRMAGYFAVQERWRQRVTEAAAAEARLEEERRLTRLVHDNVLGTLNAAAMLDGELPTVFTAMARDSIRLLEDRYEGEGEELDTHRLSSLFTEAMTMIDGSIEITTKTGEGKVPAAVAAAILEASAEAARNSLRHASRARRCVTAGFGAHRADVRIEDDGPGFRLELVASDRLGVTESIIGRMTDVHGGSAEIVSTPGAGTRVQLSWKRPPA